jgi:hypothetical protein
MAIAPPSGLLMAVHRRIVAGERHRWKDFAMVMLSGRAEEFTECDTATET